MFISGMWYTELTMKLLTLIARYLQEASQRVKLQVCCAPGSVPTRG
ncbi:hypothetical protein NIT7645_01561 [Phaeobacter italicus]|nr:hypothetical protein NIT7645_01561 [Phaeobacter italicus]SFH62615.1 hypothetical protein SAMN04488019_12232 [Phaeobacter italicus]